MPAMSTLSWLRKVIVAVREGCTRAGALIRKVSLGAAKTGAAIVAIVTFTFFLYDRYAAIDVSVGAHVRGLQMPTELVPWIEGLNRDAEEAQAQGYQPLPPKLAEPLGPTIIPLQIINAGGSSVRVTHGRLLIYSTLITSFRPWQEPAGHTNKKPDGIVNLNGFDVRIDFETPFPATTRSLVPKLIQADQDVELNGQFSIPWDRLIVLSWSLWNPDLQTDLAFAIELDLENRWLSKTITTPDYLLGKALRDAMTTAGQRRKKRDESNC